MRSPRRRWRRPRGGWRTRRAPQASYPRRGAATLRFSLEIQLGGFRRPPRAGTTGSGETTARSGLARGSDQSALNPLGLETMTMTKAKKGRIWELAQGEAEMCGWAIGAAAKAPVRWLIIILCSVS